MASCMCSGLLIGHNQSIAPMIQLVGHTVQHYQILVKVRETPTRVLYRAFSTRSQTYVAVEFVKVMNAPSELVQLINEQIQRMTELSHPNIAPIIDTGMHEGLIYIVYNFVPTQPMRRFFNRTYSWQELARELVSISHALAYAQEKNIIHGTLQPSSIVLDDKRNPMLFDFGFEQIVTNFLLVSSPGAWINRWGFEYRAPEQLRGALADSRSDVYAMGIMLHEWLLGRIAHLESTILGTLHTRKTAKRAFGKKSQVPQAIQNLIEKCISPDPDERYQSMQEIYIMLARGALDMSITRRMIRKPLEIPRQRYRLKRTQVRQMGFGVVLIGIFALLFTGSNRLNLFAPQAQPTTTAVATKTATSVPATRVPTRHPTEEPTAEFAETPESIVFPAYQNTPITSAISQGITTDNVSQMVMLSVWGSGDISGLSSSSNGDLIAASSSIGFFLFDAKTLELQRFIDTRSWITALAFSPDGKLLATGDRSGLIQLWNTSTWEEADAPLSGHTESIVDLAFSPDGRRLASVALDQMLLQWNLQAGDNLEATQLPVTRITAIAYSADSTRLVLGGNDLIITLLDSNDLSFVGKKDFSAQIVDIANVPKSKFMVIGGNNQSVVLLDLSNGLSLTPVGRLQFPLTSVVASPNGKSVAAGDLTGGVGVWDISSEDFVQLAKPIKYVNGNTADLAMPGSPHSLAFSSDGKSIFSALHSGMVRSLNPSTGERQKDYLLLDAHANQVAISHNSQYLITQQEQMLTVWNLKKASPLYQKSAQLTAGDPFSQNDQMFTAVSLDAGPATIKIFNPSNGSEVYSLGSQRGVEAIQFLDNSQQLIAVYAQAVDLWSMASGQELKSSHAFDGTGCQVIRDVNDQNVASITNYHHVVNYNENKAGLCVYDPGSWKATSINETARLIAYGDNSTLAVVNAQNVKDVRNMRDVNRKNIVSVALNPNGSLLAAAFDDYTIHIWDVETREEVMSLYGHNNTITALEFTPDGKLLISTSSDGTIRLWGVPH